MERKPHVSPSQLDLICKCGEAYRRRYIEGEKRPPGIAAHKGTGMHGGALVNFQQKIETHEDLPTQEIIDAACSSFETRLESDGIELTKEERSRGAKLVIAEGLDDTARFARVHAETQAPEHQPLMAEEAVRIELDGPRDLFGYIDVVSVPPENVSPWIRVVDFKTSGKKKSQADVDHSTQLTFYAAAAQLLLEIPPNEVMLDVIVNYKRGGPKRQVLRSTRGAEDFEALMRRVTMLQRAVDTGTFLPATPGSWWCSEKWCGYWSTCPYVN